MKSDKWFGSELATVGLRRAVLQGNLLRKRPRYPLFEIVGITQARGAGRANPSPKRKPHPA